MDKSKKFIIIFTILICSFVIGRQIGNSDYRELEKSYKELEAQYSETSFNMQGYFKLSEEQKKDLNKGIYKLTQGTYSVGLGSDIIPGTYSVSVGPDSEATISVDGQIYSLCYENTSQECQRSYENIELNEGNIIIIEGSSVQFNVQK